MILGWYDHLSSEDIPPRHIWFDSKRLKRHFDAVKGRWSGEQEAPEGTLDDVRDGRDVTLRNKLVKDWEASQDFMDAWDGWD